MMIGEKEIQLTYDRINEYMEKVENANEDIIKKRKHLDDEFNINLIKKQKLSDLLKEQTDNIRKIEDNEDKRRIQEEKYKERYEKQEKLDFCLSCRHYHNQDDNVLIDETYENEIKLIDYYQNRHLQKIKDDNKKLCSIVNYHNLTYHATGGYYMCTICNFIDSKNAKRHEY